MPHRCVWIVCSCVRAFLAYPKNKVPPLVLYVVKEKPSLASGKPQTTLSFLFRDVNYCDQSGDEDMTHGALTLWKRENREFV